MGMTINKKSEIKSHIREAQDQLNIAYSLDVQLQDEPQYLRRSIAESLVAIALMLKGRMMED